MANPDHAVLETTSVGDWCNSCLKRPYDGNYKVFIFRIRTYHMALCETCAKDMVGQFSKLVEAEKGEDNVRPR